MQKKVYQLARFLILAAISILILLWVQLDLKEDLSEYSQLKTELFEFQYELSRLQAVTLNLNDTKMQLVLRYDDWLNTVDRVHQKFTELTSNTQLVNRLTDSSIDNDKILKNFDELYNDYITPMLDEIKSKMETLREKQYFSAGLNRQFLFIKSWEIKDAADTISNFNSFWIDGFQPIINKYISVIDSEIEKRLAPNTLGTESIIAIVTIILSAALLSLTGRKKGRDI